MSDVMLPAAAATGAGVGAVVMALIGVDPQVLFWAFVGCALGVPLAPQAGRVRAAFTFLLAALASALLGTFMAAEMIGFDAPIARLALATKGLTLILGIAFHPLMTVVVSSIPSIWDGLLKKVGFK
jgi:hypothetical protein